MKIDSIRLFQVEGVMEHEEPFWEERLVRPVDVYPEHRYEHRGGLPEAAPGRYRIDAIFVQVLTDDGVTGLGGPISLDQALQIRQLASVLIGADPIAHERIWDQLYRHAVHGRKGVAMQAISALDCALWDLRGKWLDTPVYRLLGGPVRDSIPAYASALGYSLEPGRVRERARALVEEGYGAMKWFFRWGPPEGRRGMAKNLELVRVLRETVGDDVDIMLDCWMSWDLPYAVEMSRQLAQYRPRWLEEPVLPDRIDTCAAIRRAISIPVATGEHEYTRWGIRGLIDAGAADVLQPDTYWAGGLSELVKICALASSHDLPVIPHGHSVPANVHLIAAMPADTCPLLEYLVKWNQIHQFFLKNPLVPENGALSLPQEPGLGMALDEDKITSQRDIEWP